MKNILITGAAGFIGYHTSKRMCEENNEVIGIDNLNDYYDRKLKNDRLTELQKIKNFKFYECDINNNKKLDNIFKKHNITEVIHLAAQAGVRYSIKNPKAYIDSNLSGFVNILDISKENKIDHFIYASSSSVYGQNKKVPFSEKDSTDNIISLYAATKRSNEFIAHSYSSLFDLTSTGLRFFTVYGPYGRPDMAYYKFTKLILDNAEIEIFNHGDLFRDFTYIDDIIDGVKSISDLNPRKNKDFDEKNHEIYNIGNGDPVNLLDFIETLERELGTKSEKIFLEMQPGDVFKTYADISKLNKKTGYQPKISFEDGIKEFVDWYKIYHKV
jgi:UDP-glucuronate 4-epimerase